MKATGIVRKVDDLGRLVIPKEIRKSLGVNTGDPVEIYVHGQCVVVKKHNAADSIEQLLDNMERSIQMQSDLLPPAQRRDVLRKMEEMKEIVKGG